MPSPAIQRFLDWNNDAARRNQAAIAAELLRLAEIGADTYVQELNAEADRQEVGAAYAAQQHN